MRNIRNGIRRQPLLQGCGNCVRRQLARGDRHKTGDVSFEPSHIGRADMMAELVLPGVALEEAVKLDIAASELRPRASSGASKRMRTPPLTGPVSPATFSPGTAP